MNKTAEKFLNDMAEVLHRYDYATGNRIGNLLVGDESFTIQDIVDREKYLAYSPETVSGQSFNTVLNTAIKMAWGIGTEFTGEGKPISDSSLVAMKWNAMRLFEREFGYFTVQDTYGGWKDPDAGFVHESGLTYFVTVPLKDVSFTPARRLKRVGDELRKIFQQKSIYMEMQQVYIGFAEE